MSIRYFARANSCDGPVNFVTDNLHGIDKVYLIQSKFDYLKSTFISRLAAYLQEHNADCEYVCNPMRGNAYDGFVIRGKSIAVFDSQLTPLNNNCVLIDIDSCIDKKLYGSLCDYAKIVKSELEDKMDSVYSVYSGAKKLHDEWEQMYLDNIDFGMLEEYGSSVIDRIVPEQETGKAAYVYDRFFGAAMHSGNVNYIDNITGDLQKRYFIKGRPGTGKSTFLKKLTARLVQLGYDCEVYHCGFDPGSLDMVVCRELSICVFDSTAPHEKFPVEPNDEILDFYVNGGLEGVDEKLASKLLDIQLRYGKMMSLARLYMEEAGSVTDDCDSRIKDSVDFEAMNNIVYEFLYEII